jgi:hypothetical protein
VLASAVLLLLRFRSRGAAPQRWSQSRARLAWLMLTVTIGAEESDL